MSHQHNCKVDAIGSKGIGESKGGNRTVLSQGSQRQPVEPVSDVRSSDRSSSDRSGVCLSGNARIKMSNGDYKMISQIKEGDFLSTGIVKKLHITEVNDVIDLVDMSNFFITPGHLILSDNFWIRPDSINPVIQKYIDFVYNIELVDGDSFDSDGFICISLTKIYLEGKKYRVFAENYL